jgi:hypothetical protein
MLYVIEILSASSLKALTGIAPSLIARFVKNILSFAWKLFPYVSSVTSLVGGNIFKNGKVCLPFGLLVNLVDRITCFASKSLLNRLKERGLHRPPFFVLLAS